MKGTKGHRERKNGASREQWEKKKAATNLERSPMLAVTDQEGKVWRVRE